MSTHVYSKTLLANIYIFASFCLLRIAVTNMFVLKAFSIFRI